MAEVQRATVLYDEDCGFCRWALAKLLAWDRRGRVRPEPIQSPEGERLLAGMPEEERLASWHLATPDGELRSGGGCDRAAAADAAAGRAPGGPRRALPRRRRPRLPLGRRATAALLGKPVSIGARRRADAAVARRRSELG